MKRRDFLLKCMGGTSALSLINPQEIKAMELTGKMPVDSIRLYLLNVDQVRNFSHGIWLNRQHLIMQLTSQGQSGWSESLVEKNQPRLDLKPWGAKYQGVLGMSLGEALKYSRELFQAGTWNAKDSELVQFAVWDSAGKIKRKPTTELLDLSHWRPVPALFTILENNVEDALGRARIATDQNLNGFVKCKLFGDFALDLNLIRSLRNYFGPETYLLGDPNRGYKTVTNLTRLADILKSFALEGLNAIEDPSELDQNGWIQLQDKVSELTLIPDHIMRPAHKGIDVFNPAMGGIFNLHPGTMGDIQATVKLARKIRQSGRRLMIGDSSLVAAGCTAWQQIAIGAGAEWVEAVEKPQESDRFQQCIERQSTQLRKDGKIHLQELSPGFGLQVNEERLNDLADSTLEIS